MRASAHDLPRRENEPGAARPGQGGPAHDHHAGDVPPLRGRTGLRK